MKKLVCILSLDNQDIHTDARVQRQIRFLSKTFEVRLITYGNYNIPINLPADQMKIVGTLTKQRWLRQLQTVLLLSLGKIFGSYFFEIWYWLRPGHIKALNLLREWKVDFIQANDWWTLPVAIKAAKSTNSIVVLDLHEYSPEEYSSKLWSFFYKPVVEYFFKTYIREANGYATVNKIIADRYYDKFGINCEVIMNIPEINEDFEIVINPIDERRIKLVHHGYAQKERQLEKMIDVIAKCDERFTLTFILVGDQKYISQLKQYANQTCPEKITFLPGMKPDQLIPVLTKFDIGIFLTSDEHFSILTSLPNKFFEFAAAGLAVCVGPSPAMVEILDKYGFGIIVDSFDSNEIANALNNLKVSEIENKKINAINSKKYLSAEVELGKLLNLYESLIKNNK